jgi:hypothetical protein
MKPIPLFPPFFLRMVDDVQLFSNDVLGLHIPEKPERLGDARRDFALRFIEEELEEFRTSETIEDDADALIDLIYVAVGRLVEMGLPASAMFEEVHNANMAKVRGELSKRPGSMGYDATKPPGWIGPNLSLYTDTTRVDLLRLRWLSNVCARAGVTLEAALHAAADRLETEIATQPKPQPKPPGKPRIVVIGHGRHGKDTVAEMLFEGYNFSFTSSSAFCARRVIWPLLMDVNLAQDFAKHLLNNRARNGNVFERIEELGEMRRKYLSADEAFHNRGSYRTLWFEAILWHCAFDPARLARDIFKDNDIYCGIRSRKEFEAVRKDQYLNHGDDRELIVVWVDRSNVLPPESGTSMELNKGDADVIIYNNGTLEDLRKQVSGFAKSLHNPCKDV